jgi:hypothetical protein
MRSSIRRTALLLPAIAIAIGFAIPASTAVAQASQDTKTQDTKAQGDNSKSGAAASTPGSVGGVVVPGRRRTLPTVPADKKAAYDAEAAKAEAWKKYRKSMPPASAGTIGQAADYPGLNSLAPKN